METALQQLDGLLSDGWVGVSKTYYDNHKHDPDCLLRLCGQRVRADAVRGFLQAYQAEHNGSCRKLLLQRDAKTGATALHVALHRNSWAVTEIVRLLLEVAPELARMTMTSITNNNDNVYPLHIACAHFCNRDDKSDLLGMLLYHCPEAANAALTGGTGETPLRVLFGSDTKKNDSTLQKKHHEQQEQRSFFLIEPAMQIAQTALGGSDSTTRHRMTWYSLCGLTRCPAELIELLLEQQETSIEDPPHGVVRFDRRCCFLKPDSATGRLPLHAAAAQGDDALVQLVLQQAPAAASHCDGQGRLPLHCAVSNTNTNITTFVLVRLARAYPEALSVRDPHTGLYPFLAAASGNKNYNNNSQEQVATRSFELMKMDPTVFYCNK